MAATMILLRKDAEGIGRQYDGIAMYFAPYYPIVCELKRSCDEGVASNSFGFTPEAKAAMIGSLSDAEAARNPEFIQWKNEFHQVEDKFRALVRRGNGSKREFQDLTQEFRLRIILSDVVEEEIGCYALKIYMVLAQSYIAVIESQFLMK